jgi:RecA-family ATPase
MSDAARAIAIDIMAAFTTEPPALDFIWDGFLAGTVGALVAPGATGKSFLALEAAMGVASAAADNELLQLGIDNHGQVVYLAAEDPAAILQTRLHAIGAHLDQRARAEVAADLVIEPLLGKRLNMLDERHASKLIDFCRGARLIIIDTLSRVHTSDENSNGEMSRLLQVLEFLSKETGAGVLYLHHTSKSAAFNGQSDHQHAARGASVLTDNARYAASIIKMTTDEAEKFGVKDEQRGLFVRFATTKNNYGHPLADRWFKREAGGVLRPTNLERKEKTKKVARDYAAATGRSDDEW